MRKFLFMCFLFLAANVAFAQGSRITGKVTSKDDGLGLPGVTVSVKGTTQATSTDVDGNYSITVANNATLIFKSIGFASQEIAVGSRSVINIQLAADEQFLDEIVVIGYGTGKKLSESVGSIKSIGGNKITSKPSANPLDALQGQVAGVQIFTSSGEPSALPSIRLHGSGSLGAGSTPLFVIDGIPVDASTITSINPADFESVNVLKDASATSIYGSRAANGVIYFTSKKGKRNTAPVITLKGQYGISNMASDKFFKNVFSSDELFDYWVETKYRTQAQVDQLKATYPNNTSWYDVYYKKDVPTFQGDFSIQGGADKTTYFVSASYFKQEGLAYRSDFERMTMRSNVASQVTNWAKFGLNLFAGYDNRQENPYGSNNLGRGLALLRQPFYSPVDENGNEYYDTVIPGLGAFHPKYLADMNPYDLLKYTFNPSGFIELNPFKGFTLKSQVGMDFYFRDNTQMTLPSYNKQYNGSTYRYMDKKTNLTVTNTAEYKFKPVENHSATVLLGQEAIDYKLTSFEASGNGLTDDRLVLLSSAPNNRSVGESLSEYAFNSYFARLGYDFNNKYSLDLTLRQDQSSRFGRDNRTANFWAVGGLWRMKKENFLKNVTWVNDLNLRASVGTSGNSDIGNYESLALMGTTTYDGATGWQISSSGNSYLGWENQFKTTVGLGATLFDRLNVELEYYNRITSNMLVNVPYPFTSGFSQIRDNVGKLQNQGLDVELSVDAVRTKNVYISPRVTFNYNKEKVVELFQGNDYWIIPNTGVAWVVGQPRMYIYPVWAGVDSQTGNPQWYLPAEGEDGVVKETRDPNRVTSSFSEAALQQNTGYKRYAPFVGGFGSFFKVYDFEIDLDFSFAQGKYLINNDRYFFENPSQFSGYNQSRTVTDYWKQPGDIAKFPRYGVQFTQFDSRLIEDASFIRLKSLQVAYNVPSSLLKKTGFIKGTKVFFVGRNLLTFTKYTGPDPEVDSNLTLGTNPNTKQLTAGVEFKF